MMLSCRSNSRCLCLVSEVSLFYDICCELQVALVVKNLLANAGDERDMVPSLGPEDPLEEGMATHSSILAWTISWTEEPRGVQSIRLQRVGHD